MKVLFLNPPYFPMFSRESRSPSVTKSSTLYWPMFMCYAAGCVEEDGNELLIIDSPAMDLDLEGTLEKIKAFKPEFAVLNTSTPSINNDMRVGRLIKEAVGCPVAMMGTHATAEPMEILDSRTFHRLCDCWRSRLHRTRVDPLSARRRPGSHFQNSRHRIP